jgi:hypothetical protein
MPDLPDWQKKVRIDNIYTQIFLAFCHSAQVKPLQDILATGQGKWFCSTEEVFGCSDFHEVKRAISVLNVANVCNKCVELHYSTDKVVSDTLRSSLSSGDKLSIVGQITEETSSTVRLEPVIMGFPCLFGNAAELGFDPIYFHWSFFEHYVEDFDEFEKVRNVPRPDSPGPMKEISETAFKKCLGSILGDHVPKDWGGENSDYFSAHLHLQKKRISGAFLLKGPHNFKPMTLNHLGKNNDQIVRLSHEPADVLFVQHCHDILPPVRETLRAFAVQPCNSRRYCLIDGRDSFRLLQAYNLYDKAVALSKG